MSLLDFMSLQRVLHNGVELFRRKRLNFVGGTVTDDPANDALHIELASGGGEGTVNGPVSSVTGHVATWLGTDGTEIDDSGVLLADLATEAYVDAAIDALAIGGDVVGPASSVADRIALFDGTTGKLIKDSGVVLADLTAALAKKVYRGGYNVNMAYTNGDWYDLPLAASGGSWRDDEQVGITRSSGTFTVAAAGYYHVDAACLAFYSSTNPLMGIRVTRTHSAVTTIAMSKADYAGTGSATSNNVEVHGVVYCDAGDTLNVQYCFYDAPGSAPGFGLNAPGAGEMRGQATDLAMIHIHRIPYLL